MTKHNLFYYPCRRNGASRDTIGADHVARDAVKLLNSPCRLGVNAMNPNLNRPDDGKTLEMMQGQGPRDALTEVQDWALERIAGVRASSPQATMTKKERKT